MFRIPRRRGSVISLAAFASGLSLFVATGARTAHAQFTTSSTYDENVVQTATVNVIAAGSSYSSVAAFQTVMSTAFAANTGGVIGFDNVAPFNPGASFTATYGASAANTLTVTSPSTLTTNYSIGTSSSTTFGTISGAIVGSNTYTNYIGNTIGATTLIGAPVQEFQNIYQFSKGLSTFGITVVARGAARGLNMVVNFSDSSSTMLTGTQGNNDYVFFNLNAPTNLTISSVNVYSPDGFIRMDDMAFVVGSSAAPEPGSAVLLLPFAGIFGGIAVRRTRITKTKA